MPTWTVILLAVLAPGGVITVLLERLRRENNRDHNRNIEMLRTIDRKVDGVSERVDDHVQWHLGRGSDR